MQFSSDVTFYIQTQLEFLFIYNFRLKIGCFSSRQEEPQSTNVAGWLAGYAVFNHFRERYWVNPDADVAILGYAYRSVSLNWAAQLQPTLHLAS
jgi:hypothetical protein